MVKSIGIISRISVLVFFFSGSYLVINSILNIILIPNVDVTSFIITIVIALILRHYVKIQTPTYWEKQR